LDWDPSLAYSGRHLFWLEGFKRVSDLKKEGAGAANSPPVQESTFKPDNAETMRAWCKERKRAYHNTLETEKLLAKSGNGKVTD
jgi:hypothetical protein